MIKTARGDLLDPSEVIAIQDDKSMGEFYGISVAFRGVSILIHFPMDRIEAQKIKDLVEEIKPMVFSKNVPDALAPKH